MTSQLTPEQIAELRKYAVYAGSRKWNYIRTSPHSSAYIIDEEGSTIVNVSKGDVPANCAGFLEAANPATVLFLLDALEARDKRIAELTTAACVDNQWKPEVCPVTGRKFFMWIYHPDLGHVPTYGGPFDSYTIPVADSCGELYCEHFDHDFGGWREGESIDLHIVSGDDMCNELELQTRAESAEQALLLEKQKSAEHAARMKREEFQRERQFVIDQLSMAGETWDEIEGYMVAWDAEHECAAAGISLQKGDE